MHNFSIKKDRSQLIKEVIVYQMGKVGSTSIVASINEAGIPAYQSHFLDTLSFHDAVDLFVQKDSVEEEFSRHITGQLHENLLLRNKLTSYKNSKARQTAMLGIITLVREPLAWYFSNLSQNFYQIEKPLREWLIHEHKLSKEEPLTEWHLEYFFSEVFSCFCRIVPDMDQSHASLVQSYFNKAGTTTDGKYYRFIYSQVSTLSRIHFWFDRHFANVMDIDVLRYDFDQRQGYSIFHRNNVDIMLIAFEKLNQLSDELSRFIGLPSFELKRLNESKTKKRGQLIANTRKTLHIPEDFKQLFFSSEYYATFYKEHPSQDYRFYHPRLKKRRQEDPNINLVHSPVDDISNCHMQKREALESFVSFGKGEGLPGWPLEIGLEVSNQCDMSCAMCPSYSPLNDQKYLHLPTKTRGLLNIDDLHAIDEVLQHAILVHLWGYGEPTQHPRFAELIEYLAQFEVLVDFSTHGMNLTQSLCDLLVKHSVHKVNINFSGATKEDYESIYVGCIFDQVLENIRALAESKKKYASNFPIISVTSIAFDFNIEKLPLFVEIMAEHGVETIILKPLNTHAGIPELHSRVVIMEPDKHTLLLEQAHEIARKHGISLITTPFTNTANLPGESAADKAQFHHNGNDELCKEHFSLEHIKSRCLSKKVLPPDDQDSPGKTLLDINTLAYTTNDNIPCFELLKSLAISHDSKIYPCAFGNREIYTASLSQSPGQEHVWQSPLFSQLREHSLTQQLPTSYCSSCLKSNMYPKHHNMGDKALQYNRWFKCVFGTPFHIPVMKDIKNLPDNRQIIERNVTSQ